MSGESDDHGGPQCGGPVRPLKVLLLNPPGKRIYIRDYYCSKVSKSNYVVHPVDLLMLSGRVASRYELHIIDAIADKLEPSDCLSKVEKIAPDVIISLIASVSLDEDCAFLSKLKKDGRRIVVSGDIVLAGTEEWLRQHPFVDAALLDFTSGDIVPYIEGETVSLQSMVLRNSAGKGEIFRRESNQEFDLPMPRQELFVSLNYRFPFSRHRQFATVLTDYGCPYRCSFCVMSTIGYKYRSVGSVMEELRAIWRLGIREIYFSDQTFAVNKRRTLELCGQMAEEGLDLGWTCFSRVDLITEELLAAMQGAGCHTIMLGVETASEEILEKYGKGYTLSHIRRAFKLCKSRKIRTVGTFILGLPEETEETAMATIALAKELECDFASFNVAVPRIGTHLREEALRDRLIKPDVTMMDQSGLTITMPTKHLTVERLQELRGRAIREFYLRPGYLWRRLMGISNFHELREQLFEGWALLSGLWRNRNPHRQ